MTESSEHHGHHRILIAVFTDRERARQTVEGIIDEDFPMDQLSLLGRGESAGDDPLGIYYSGPGERIKAWGAHGAFWGALWGLFAGAAGMFVFPGVGSIFAIGPIVEAIAAAVTSATVAAGTMAGAAAISQLAVALHRMGVPGERLQHYHDEIGVGHYLVLMRCGDDEAAQRWLQRIRWYGAAESEVFEYRP
jgi:hypothetical protein